MIFLVFVTIIFIVVVGIFLVKLLIELSSLTKNLDDTTTLVKQEIKPTLKELQTALESINNIANSADKQFDTVKKMLTSVLGASTLFISQMRNLSGGFLKGVFTGIKFFTRK